MVLSRWHLQEMESYWFPFVDPRQTYVPLHLITSVIRRLHSGLWKDHPMVRPLILEFNIGNLWAWSSSAIIQDIMTRYKAGLAITAYFYFDFRDIDKQSRNSLLSSLLLQLSAQSDPCCDILFRLYEAHDNGARQPNDGALAQCLKEMLVLPIQSPMYLILDALDECPNTSEIPPTRKRVLDLVKDLIGLRLPNLHICVTSRPEVDIRDIIEPLAFYQVSLHDESGQKQDITTYVKSVVNSTSSIAMSRWRAEEKELVIRTLSERADGM